MLKRVECRVTGRVQMVMFRDFTVRKAKSLGLVGSVKNENDGSVFIVAEGDESRVKNFITLLHKGSIFSRVDNVKVIWFDFIGELSNFKILYN
ncbi:MAG: acylphosphatase [Patescibacteria group bacterium]